MGYTHYYRRSLVGNTSQEKWELALIDCERILFNTDIPFVRECNNDAYFGINGEGDDAYETFVLPRNVSEIREFNFCKTGERPYDTLVTACLARMAETGVITVSSDGSHEDFQAGVELASTILGREVSNPISIEDY